MNPAQVEELRAVFKEALDLGEDIVIQDLEYNAIRNWDSVAHMTLVAAIEELFTIMLETDDVLDMSSFKKAVEIVSKYVAAS